MLDCVDSSDQITSVLLLRYHCINPVRVFNEVSPHSNPQTTQIFFSKPPLCVYLVNPGASNVCGPQLLISALKRRACPLRPEVRCGSVYITPSDSTTKVVQAVLATPTVKEKKRRAVKYTVAVGTSHGHVQAFLKDSDVVLGAFDQCPAEEKCLMLIKRPKESSKKLSKAQSGNSLSMSDTQLYRQFDGTAFNAPHSAHRMKDKTNATNDGRDQVTSQIYNSEPRVRRAAAPAAISAAHRKWPAARPNNTFVPIPELGIYTPEQHVLQNGTYAQHCHLREVNNNSHNTAGRRNMANGHSGGDGAGGGRYDNKPLSARTANNNHVTNSAYAINNTNHHNNHNNNNKMNHNSSLNSSFDESVSSYGYAPVKGVLRGYDPAAASGNIRYPSGDVYHSCVDISHTYRDGGEDEFNTLSSRRSYDPPGYAPIREEELEHVRGRNRSPEPPNRRRGESDKRQPGDRLSEEPAEEDAAKMDSGARSFSLGDLSAGLTFSLAGQQKSGSVTAVNGGGRKGRGLSSPGLAPKSARPAPSAASISSNDREEGSSALRHIRERLQKAVFKSQDRKSNSTNQPSTQAPRNAQSREGGGQYQRQYDNKQPPPHDNKQPPPPHQRQRQDQPHPPYQRQVSAPEGSQLLMSSPRNRRDSEDTTSSYRSVQSDNSNFANSNQNIPLSYSGLHNNAMGRNNKNINNCGNNNISNSSNSISSTLNNTDSSGNSFATAKSSSTVTNSTEINNAHPSHSQASNRDKSTASPTKPKRSLPNVPLSETSERIKRFTEMMKSRMSSGSRTGSSNGSRSGSSAKHTPTQRSTDSACSHTSLSRKSSMETASDSEVFTINNGTSTNNVRPPHGAGGGNTKHQPYQPQNIILPNQYPDFNERKNNGHGAHTTHNGPGSRHDDHHAQMSKGYTGQGQGHHTQRPLTSEDTPLPLGDRSTDSGQTTGTNQSYNGSAMDSGYTTNNDADNDSFNTHNQHHLQHHQPFQSLEPHQQQRHQHHESSGHQNHHSYHHQPQHHHHHHHPPHRQQTSGTSSHHAAHHQQYSSSTVSKSHNARSVNGLEKSDLPHPGLSSQQSHRPQFKRKSNLANAHRFGSVQNVSSLQAHGNPRDMDPLGNESTSYWHGQQQLSQNRNAGALSARERSSRQIYEENQTGLLDRRQNSGGRRSWDFADARMDNDRIGDPHFNNSNLKTYDRGAAHYKSTEVISSTKPLFTDANYVNTNHIQQSAYQSNKSGNNHINSGSNKTALTLQEQSRAIAAKFRSMHLSNGADSMSQSYHGGTTNQLPQNHGYGSNGVPNHSSSSTSQAKYSNNPKTFTSNGNSSAQPPSHRHNYQKHQNPGGQAEFKGNTTQQHQQFHDRHQLHPLHANQCHPLPHSQTNGSNNNGGVVKLRPVPMSRANRNARGRTLPGGFRFTDAEIAAAGAAGDGKNPLPSQNTKQPGQDQGQEVMLFHLTQKFDLCPLLINLPRHVSLRDLLELSEFQVEISLVGVPGAEGSPLGGPSSPQGPVASKIGSPGSAFTPVRNSQDFEGGSGAGAGADAGKVMTAKVKVIRFIRVWGEELQRHTTLGRLLEGDIVVEVNGWFCLGADVTYLAQVVESCQGAITFTVARHKESEEKRFKGQTPVERVKGLEAEISRLDDIIHSKDEKIREMTSSRENLSGQQGALTAVNGEVPVEGMVIGEDEYVV
ncbi:hypothetical protein RRG08_007773 [Elysia crispata]|uniref:PDZ domain-containing protein n=1 Tax=Elysia crispata TaxID=231223 RepID=A0AAE1B2B5_9GAST|nr:hypothetical protein RRG08_007773 [Elysia crispata]